jgi:hypothetical protein
MFAKVRDDYPLSVVTAFGGREYTKKDWRPVPVEEEETARRLSVKTKDQRAMFLLSDEMPRVDTELPITMVQAAPGALPANENKTVRLVRKKAGA